ncbi:MAG: histidine kinase [Mariniphaga sp.]
MKKTFFNLTVLSLLSLFQFCTTATAAGSINNTKPEAARNKDIQPRPSIMDDIERTYWRYLKERLFDGQRSVVASFQDDISIQLLYESSADRIIVENLMKELRLLIPARKIGFYDPRSLKERSILIFFNNNSATGIQPVYSFGEITGNQIIGTGFKGYSQKEIFPQTIHIQFADSISLSERKRYIEYAIVRTLCNMKGDQYNIKTHLKNAIFNEFGYNPTQTEFTPADKFLIKKLYSKDFQAQFRKFMIENDSWWHYMIFTNNTLMTMWGIIASIFLSLMLFIVFIKPVFVSDHKRKYLGYLLPGLFMVNLVWLVFFTMFYFTTMNGFVEWFGIITEIAINNVAAVIITYLLYFLEHYILSFKKGFLVQVLMKVLILWIVLMITTEVYLQYFDVEFELLGYGLWNCSAFAIGRGAFLLFKEFTESLVRQKDLEISKLKELKSRAEVESLHARINPHFLYNSLNSIAGLAHSNPDKTEQMALSLSDLFRYSINRKGEHMSPISDEVKMVQSYLEIEQIRFGDRLGFTIDVAPGLEQRFIPKYIIQPLVENAIKHGITRIEGKGEIVLGVHEADGGIIISVEDNGPAFPEGLVSGYGLQSLYDLLKLSYGENAEVDWQNEPKKMIWVLIKNNANTNGYVSV